MTNTTLEVAAEDLAALVESVDDLLASRWDPSHPANADAVFSGLTDIGLPELIGDSAVGDGLGQPIRILSDVLRAAGRHLAPGPLFEQTFVRPFVEAQLGTELPAGIVALVDPAATDDWRLERGDITLADGNLTGSVDGIAYAQQATVWVVVVGERLVVVSPSAAGVSVTGHHSLDPGTPIATVTFAGYAVADGPVVSDSNAVAELRAWAQVLIAAELSGIADATVEMSREYSLQRHQFGKPIAAFQVIRHILADMATHAIALANLVNVTAGELATLPPAERDESAAIAKAYAATMSLQICEQALQVHGGIGFVEEHRLHRYLKAALRRHAAYGTPGELHTRIGKHLLSAADKTLEGQGDRDYSG